MVPYKKLFLICICILFAGRLFAQNYPNAEVDSLIRNGVDNLLIQNYQIAQNSFEKLDKKFPELPLGKIYLVALSIAKSYDFKEPYSSDYIEDNLDTAENRAQMLLDKNENNIWYNYFMAAKEGYYAYYQALERNWLSAFSNGVSAVKGFEKCLKMNPDFYESYTAIGAFKYWSSRKTEFLKWLPFRDDQTKQGIEFLKKAIKHSTYSSYLATNSLMWIYIDQENYKDAITLGENTLKKYPGSRFFMWPLARAYEDINLQKSINIYQQILVTYLSEKDNNHINEIVLKHIIAQQYIKLGDKEKALKLCNEILNNYKLSDYAKDRLERRLNRVKKLKNDLTAG